MIEFSTDKKIPEHDTYNLYASKNTKIAVFIWCLAGYIYAAWKWHILWLPGILIFFPGIWIASLIGAGCCIPLWFIEKKIKGAWDESRQKHWGLLLVGTMLRIGALIGPIAGVVGYIQVLQWLLE